MNSLAQIKLWVGQSTTGQGFAILVSTFMAWLGGQMPLAIAIPTALGGVVLVLWPQNTGLAAAVTEGASIFQKIVAAYRLGTQHGAETGQPAGPVLVPAALDALTRGAAPSGQASPPVTPSVPGAAMVLGLVMLGISACTPVQQGQTLAATTAAYISAASLETLAIKSGKLSDADVAEMKRIDNVAYNALVAVQKVHATGGTPSAAQTLAATLAVTALSEYLTAKGIK